MDEYNPHKTAIFRSHEKMTRPASWLLEKILEPREIHPKSVLDFGAGKSYDAEIWAEKTGSFSQGYDQFPHKGFEERIEKPTQLFDLVTMNFILNIIDSEQDRMSALLEASSYVAPKGYLWVATRSKNHIDSQGEDKGWGVSKHGSWISHPSKGTVRFGMDGTQIVELVRKCELYDFETINFRGRPTSTTGCAFFQRKEM